ncbi:MAG: hypothetical protein OEL83_03390 [Desulforhopalus sp.]|nr:hypothetical protein [Desulforhopalus sp.]
MNKFKGSLSFLKQFWQHFLFGILLASLFYFFIKQSATAITITFNADQASVMSVISSGTMIDKEYRAGQSKQTFKFAKIGKKRTIRLDPFSEAPRSEDGILKEQRITISSISIENLGDEVSISGSDLLKHLVISYQLNLQQTGNSLTVKSTSDDPQLYLRYPRPSRPVGYIIVLYCLGLILLFYMLRIEKGRSSEQDTKSKLFMIFVLPLCAGIFISQSYLQLILLSVLIVALVYIFIRTLNERIHAREIFSSLKYLIPISVFILIIFTPVFRTISSLKFVDELKGLSLYDKENHGYNITQRSIKQFLKNFEESYSQSYYFRTELLHYNASIKLGLFHHSPTKKAIIGKEGMFFEGHGMRQIEGEKVGYIDTISDYLGLSPFTDQELEQWRIVLEERYYWLKEQGISFIFAMAPDKSQIYPEYYPDKINSIKVSRETRRYDQLVNYLKDNSIIPVVDLRKALLDVKEQAAAGAVPQHMLFYRTDGHWNAYGAFWAYRAIVNQINASYPKFQVPVVDIGDFVIHEKKDMVHKAFMNLIGTKNERGFYDTFLTLFPKPHTVHAAQSDFLQKGINIDIRWKIVTKTNNNGQIPFLFIAGDSFGQQMAGYFSVHAKHIIVRRFVNHFDPNLIKSVHTNVYIHEMLNMYLLYKVPENPEIVKMARKRALERS